MSGECETCFHHCLECICNEETMDKLIKKVKKPLDSAEKAVKVLKKADKKFDKKIEEAAKMKKCDMKMKKKK